MKKRQTDAERLAGHKAQLTDDSFNSPMYAEAIKQVAAEKKVNDKKRAKKYAAAGHHLLLSDLRVCCSG